jgi:hypothetical protein
MKEHDYNSTNRNGLESAHSNSAPRNSQTGSNKEENNQLKIPKISLPKGGGAIKSIDEKFSVNILGTYNKLSLVFFLINFYFLKFFFHSN